MLLIQFKSSLIIGSDFCHLPGVSVTKKMVSVVYVVLYTYTLVDCEDLCLYACVKGILIKAQTDSGDQGLPDHSKKKRCKM